MYSLRLQASGAITSSTGLGSALGRFRGGGAAAGWIRAVSATPNPAAAPVPGDQGVSMEHSRQKQPPPPPRRDGAASGEHQQPPPPPRRDEAAAGEQQQQGTAGNDETHQTTAKGDVMSHSFGEGYSTRSDEEGFGGTYGGNDPVFNWSGGDVHPSHPATTSLASTSTVVSLIVVAAALLISAVVEATRHISADDDRLEGRQIRGGAAYVTLHERRSLVATTMVWH